MDKNEFYKQLLTEYTFDAEKIKRNAKRTSVRSFWQSAEHMVPLVGAAALTLVIGGYALINALSPANISVTPDTASSDALARIRQAEAGYLAASDGEEALSTLYVSFSKALTLSEVKLVLSGVSDTGEIRVEGIYTADGESYFTADEMNQYSAEEKQQILGAKLSAPLSCYMSLAGSSIISLVEIGCDTITDDTFHPISGDEMDAATATVSETTTTSAISETTVGTTVTTPAETTSQTSAEAIVSETEETSETTTVSESSESDISSDVTISGEITADSTVSISDQTTSVPEETSDENDDYADSYLETVIPGVKSISFIGDSCFAALTENGISLYNIYNDDGGRRIECAASALTYNPTVVNRNAQRNVLLITGCEAGGARTELYIVKYSENGGTLTEVDVSEITDGTEIGYAYYDNVTGNMLLKTVSLVSSRLYKGTKSGDEYSFTKFAEYDAPCSILSADENRIFFSIEDGGKTLIVKYDCATRERTEIASFDGSVIFARSNKLGNFSATFTGADGANVTEFFNAETASFGTEQGIENISYSSYSDSEITDGVSYYTVSADGGIVEIPIDMARRYYAVNDNSKLYALYEIDGDTVRIMEK